MKALVKIWTLALRNSLADRSAYRGDFVLGFFVTMLFEMVTPVVTLLLYQTSRGTGFPGWTLAEALLIQAVFLVSRGIAFPVFFSLVGTVNQLVREGSFELVLLKPRSALLVCLTKSINIQALGRLVGGVALLWGTLGLLPTPSPSQFAAFFLLMGLSLVVLFGFALFLAGSLFVWVGNGRLMELAEALFLFGQYPSSIFAGGFQLLLTLVPVSLIAAFPAQALLGRDLGWLWAAAPVGLMFCALGVAFWKGMIRRYSGAGG